MTRSEKNSALYDALLNEMYLDEDEMAMKLGDILGGFWEEYDTKIDDACEDWEADEYIMVSCFESRKHEIVKIYYGNCSLIIGNVSYRDK